MLKPRSAKGPYITEIYQAAAHGEVATRVDRWPAKARIGYAFPRPQGKSRDRIGDPRGITLPYLVELRKCARCRPTALAANRADARARIRFRRKPSPTGKNQEDGRQPRSIAAKVSCRSTTSDMPT